MSYVENTDKYNL